MRAIPLLGLALAAPGALLAQARAEEPLFEASFCELGDKSEIVLFQRGEDGSLLVLPEMDGRQVAESLGRVTVTAHDLFLQINDENSLVVLRGELSTGTCQDVTDMMAFALETLAPIATSEALARVSELESQIKTLQALLDVAQEVDQESQAEIERLRAANVRLQDARRPEPAESGPQREAE